jgi:hypothetical protein
MSASFENLCPGCGMTYLIGGHPGQLCSLCADSAAARRERVRAALANTWSRWMLGCIKPTELIDQQTDAAIEAMEREGGEQP